MEGNVHSNEEVQGVKPMDETAWSFYFWTPSAEHAYSLLYESIFNRDRDGNPRGLRVIGDSRLGKTTFLRNSRARLAIEHPEVAERLVIAEPPVESRDVETAIRQQILSGAHHPMALMYPKRDVVNGLSERVLLDCSGLIWDEGHAFYKDKTEHFRQQATTFLRLAMNRTKKPVILLGVPLLDKFIELNHELNNRLRARAELRPFSLGSDKEEALFASFLAALQNDAPVAFIPTLQEEHMLLRCFGASDGYPGHFMDIANRVVARAIRKSEGVVDLSDWALAFADEFPERAAVFNPFAEGHSVDALLKCIFHRAEQLAKVFGEDSRRPGSRKGQGR